VASTKDVLKAVKNKTGKSISESSIKKLASGVTANTLKNEAQLRKLVRQVAKMAGVSLSDSAVSDIVRTVKNSNITGGQLERLVKMLHK